MTAKPPPHVSPDDRAYEIRVAGHLDDHWSAVLGDLTLTRHGDGTTTLSGPLADQAQLHGVLARVRDLGVTLLDLRLLEGVDADQSSAESASSTTPAQRPTRVSNGSTTASPRPAEPRSPGPTSRSTRSGEED